MELKLGDKMFELTKFKMGLCIHLYGLREVVNLTRVKLGGLKKAMGFNLCL